MRQRRRYPPITYCGGLPRPSLETICLYVCRLAFVASTSNDTGKTQMTCGRIHRFGVTRGRSVAAAIVWRTQMRAAFNDLARNLDCGLTRIVAVLFSTATRTLCDTACLRRVGLMLGRP